MVEEKYIQSAAEMLSGTDNLEKIKNNWQYYLITLKRRSSYQNHDNNWHFNFIGEYYVLKSLFGDGIIWLDKEEVLLIENLPQKEV